MIAPTHQEGRGPEGGMPESSIKKRRGHQPTFRTSTFQTARTKYHSALNIPRPKVHCAHEIEQSERSPCHDCLLRYLLGLSRRRNCPWRTPVRGRTHRKQTTVLKLSTAVAAENGFQIGSGTVLELKNRYR